MTPLVPNPQASRAAANSSSTAVTLEVTPSSLAASDVAPPKGAGFIEGSNSLVARETASLLRYRLRAAAGFLLLAISLFFAYRLFYGDTFTRTTQITFYFHLALIVALATSCALLCRRCVLSVSVLRVHELVIFGLTSVYLMLYDYELLVNYAPTGFLPGVAAAWMGITFAYSMFIPNDWRRAAVVHALLCAAPLVLILYLNATDAEFAATLRDNRLFITESIIYLGVTFLAATYGTYMINALRTEAFEARQLGQYRLCRLIGSGGMGEVYLAEHQMMKRPCAIKLIRPSKANDPQALARFEREVRATAALSHWNSIEIFDYGRSDDGTFYYVMEYLPGMSLAELVERHGPLPAGRAIHLLLQTCDALAEAHARGLVHRDLKPGNIFSAQRGGVYDVAKILDFGLAKPISADNSQVQLTQDGAITGSPLYMSPEQALSEGEPDARSDIYSLGAVAYFLLTGAPPFAGDKAIRLILAHAHDEVVPPTRLQASVPRDVEAVVMKCLAKDPAARFQSAGGLRQALAGCHAASSWTFDDARQWWEGLGHNEATCEAATEVAF